MPTLDELEAEYARLLKEKEVNDRAIADINGQLFTARTDARVNGVYADADWFGRAQHAKQRCGQRNQVLQRQIGDVRRRIGKLRALIEDRCFVEAARMVLPPDEFARVCNVAKQMREVALGGLAGPDTR